MKKVRSSGLFHCLRCGVSKGGTAEMQEIFKIWESKKLASAGFFCAVWRAVLPPHGAFA